MVIKCKIIKTPNWSEKLSRLTITIDDQLHQALKETAARQRRTIGSIIEESLRLRGIRTYESAQEIVRRVREASELDSDKALQLAVQETRQQRREKSY